MAKKRTKRIKVIAAELWTVDVPGYLTIPIDCKLDNLTSSDVIEWEPESGFEVQDQEVSYYEEVKEGF